MSEHPLSKAPNSKPPYLALSFYDYQEWFQLIDHEKLSKWEVLRVKSMSENYTYARMFLQIPLFALSYYSAHLILGPPLRRRDAGFRENLLFGTFFYILYSHWLDKVQVPDRYFDELYTQNEPNGDYLKILIKEWNPLLWKDIKEQLTDKGFEFKDEPEKFNP